MNYLNLIDILIIGCDHMNKKGFAISGILYSIFVLFLLVMVGILQVFQNRAQTIEKLKEEVKTQLESGS